MCLGCQKHQTRAHSAVDGYLSLTVGAGDRETGPPFLKRDFMRIETVKIVADNAEGYYICNADAVPKGAKIFKPKKQPTKKGK